MHTFFAAVDKNKPIEGLIPSLSKSVFLYDGGHVLMSQTQWLQEYDGFR